MSKPELPANFADQTPKPRVVQHNKKRYSIRLEPVFWRALEHLAEHRKMRLGKFIGQLEDIYQGQNFSSFLRVFCMVEAEKALADSLLRPEQDTIEPLLEASPSPAALLADDMTIVSCNDAFYDWLGEEKLYLEGSSVTKYFQIRTKGNLQEAWRTLMDDSASRLEARILRVVPGRVTTAHARIVRTHGIRKDAAFAVIWIISAPRLAASRLETPSAQKHKAEQP